MPRKNLKVSEEWYEKHKPKKDAAGLSWEEYLDGQAPDLNPLSEADMRRVVREEIDTSDDGERLNECLEVLEGCNEQSVSNEDIMTAISTLSEKIDRLPHGGR